jgi:hypothetical protein
MSAALFASSFPEDPIMVLRAGWPFLATYYAVAGIIVFVLWRLLKASRFSYSTRGRAITSAILTIIFAPSEVSDFFLFNLPGPALLGLVFLLIALSSAEPASPSAFSDWHAWVGFLGVIAIYVVPLVITFAIAYGVLSFYVRSHPRALSSA